MRRRCHLAPVVAHCSAFVGFRFPPEVFLVAVRWYLRFGLSYRDVEELLAERGVDHVSLFAPCSSAWPGCVGRYASGVSLSDRRRFFRWHRDLVRRRWTQPRAGPTTSTGRDGGDGRTACPGEHPLGLPEDPG
jgi:hypothetical protein